MRSTIAVVTGLVIDYSRANQGTKTEVNKKLELVVDRYQVDSLHLDGDRFRCQTSQPIHVMRMILELRASLKQFSHKQHPKGLDVRSSIGVGEIDPGTDSNGLATSAEYRSIKGLDVLARRNGRLGVFTGNQLTDSLFGTTFRLLDRVIGSWSPSQADAINYALQGMTQLQIAEALGITQPSVNNRLKLAQWNEIMHLIEVWESIAEQEAHLADLSVAVG